MRPPAAKKSKQGEILDAGEDEQLAAAIRASLAESQPKKAGETDEADSEYREAHVMEFVSQNMCWSES